jgi:L-alanine-DL-glutamate epimerase-like enolase superfamily enzyme
MLSEGLRAHHMSKNDDIYIHPCPRDFPTEFVDDQKIDVVDMGLTALKFDLYLPENNEPGPMNGRLTNEIIEHKREIIKPVREEISHDVSLAFDITEITPLRAPSASPTDWRKTT